MIKRFLLPHCSPSLQLLINEMGGRAFHRVENLGQHPDSLNVLIDKRDQNHVRVIWHHHYSSQVVANVMVVQTRLEYEIAGDKGHFPPPKCAEGDEMWFVIKLKMRKVPTIERHNTPAWKLMFDGPRAAVATQP